jgi:hypothetical protein
VPFDSLSEANIEKAVNYVKTKTLLQLLNPHELSERDLKKVDNPIILVFCQPSE